MGLKAKNGRVEAVDVPREEESNVGYGWSEREAVEFPGKPEENPQGVEDGVDDLVMVMMPRQTFDAFQELAKRYGGSHAQAMSTALKLLEKACEAAEDGGD